MIDSEFLLDSWPDETRQIAREMAKKYGEPDESTITRFIWHGREPWHELVVYRDFVEHDFPQNHVDALEATLKFCVEPETIGVLSAFNGSLSFNQTRGTMSITCKNEAVAMLIANYAYFIVHNVLTPTRAKIEFKKAYRSLKSSSPVAEAIKYYFA